MKKSLLFAAALFAATSSFAHEVDDVVLTAKGRYQIVAAENLIKNDLVTLDGWSAISATEGRTVKDQFTFNGDGIVSTYSEPTEGMSINVTNLDGNSTYILSLTITAPETAAGSTNFNTRLGETFDGATYANSVQKLNIIGTDADGATTEVGFPTEILPGTYTYNWAIEGDGTPRSYEIKLAGWNTNLVISDIQLQEANNIGDIRKLQQLVDYLKAIKDMYEWKEEAMSDLNEMVEVNESVIAECIEATEIESAVTDLEAFIDEFLKENADDQLPNALDKLPKAASKVSKQGSIGAWKDDANRIHSAAGDYYDLGHFQYSNGWGNAGSNGRIGLVNYGLNLVPGTYIFAVDLKANAREFVKNAWSINEGLQFADGILSIVDANDADNKVEIATTGRYPISANSFTKNWLVFKVETAGVYDIRIDTYAKEEYNGIKSGSVVFPFGASLFAVTGAKYSKAELDYEIDVRNQITAGRDAITKATEYLADATKPWAKEVLTTALNDYEPVIADYEQKTQDDIIATLDKEIYDASKGLEETTQDGDLYRMMAAEVYANATKALIAANREFEEKNNKLATLATAIEAAKLPLTQRVYGMATGKADLEAAIAAAENKDAELRADDYSEENATTVDDAVAVLNNAVVEFKASIPADCIKNIVDLTGNLSAEEAEVGYLVSGTNKVGALSIENNYYPDPNAGKDENENAIYAFSIGYILAEENAFPNLLRVGNGNATVSLDGIAENDIVQVSFDYYYGNLNGRYASFYVNNISKDETDADVTNTICGLNVSKYDGKADVNTFEIDVNAELTAVGASNAANDAIAAESNKNSYTISIDLATKEMTCNIVSGKGTFNHTATNTVEGVPTQFVVGSNYNNADRRSFFGNLVIRTIKGGETTGIKETVAKSINNGKIYNAAGMEVKSFVKGINIVNGKKFVK